MLRQVSEVCVIYCATAIQAEVVLAETAGGRGIVGVVDGAVPTGIEQEADIAERQSLLRRIGYKL